MSYKDPSFAQRSIDGKYGLACVDTMIGNSCFELIEFEGKTNKVKKWTRHYTFNPSTQYNYLLDGSSTSFYGKIKGLAFIKNFSGEPLIKVVTEFYRSKEQEPFDKKTEIRAPKICFERHALRPKKTGGKNSLLSKLFLALPNFIESFRIQDDLVSKENFGIK